MFPWKLGTFNNIPVFDVETPRYMTCCNDFEMYYNSIPCSLTSILNYFENSYLLLPSFHFIKLSGLVL